MIHLAKSREFRMVTTKIHLLRQGARPVSVYATKFCPLICDVDWDDNAFISVFR
jgi:hypothetical protein